MYLSYCQSLKVDEYFYYSINVRCIYFHTSYKYYTVFAIHNDSHFIYILGKKKKKLKINNKLQTFFFFLTMNIYSYETKNKRKQTFFKNIDLYKILLSFVPVSVVNYKLNLTHFSVSQIAEIWYRRLSWMTIKCFFHNIEASIIQVTNFRSSNIGVFKEIS